MSRTGLNIFANYAASFWLSVMSLVFIPLYIRFMGVESFGLIGIFASLQALFSLLDLGLGTTLNREMARLTAPDGTQKDARDLVRTLEVIYWLTAGVICLAIWLLAGPIAHHWVNAGGLSADVVERAVVIMGPLLAARWPVALYRGGLLGLQRQVLSSSISGLCATLQGVGSVLVLWKISPTIQAFLVWQIVAGLVETVLMWAFLWRILPETSRRPRFRKDLLAPLWRFSAGMFGLSVVTVILTHADKIVLSKMLRLEAFGYYTLAWSVAGALLRLVTPIYTAVFPRLSQLAASASRESFSSVYHAACQLVSVAVLPAACVLAVFSYPILSVWVRDPVVVGGSYAALTILAVGMAINSLTDIPMAAQLAHGWTSLALTVQGTATVILVPFLILATGKYGMLGAAIVWMVLNASYLITLVPLMHGRILKGELPRWYLVDFGLPLLGASIPVIVGRIIMPGNLSDPVLVVYVALVGVLSLSVSALAAPAVRASVWAKIVSKVFAPNK